MKKIMNEPSNFVSEMLEGIYLANSHMLEYVNDDLHCLVTKNKKPGKVAIATGGGSGHLPLFLGYVGDGLADGCAVGDVFQSPSAEQIHAITKHIDNGAGVLYIYGNYNGDIFNFDMAADMADMEDGIRVETVLGADDVATPAPEPGKKSTRRGVAGIFFVYKCAGAAALKMMDLDNVKRIAEKSADNTRTMGVALSPCIVPRVGRPSFQLTDEEMEIGMGIHGEPGISKTYIKTADEIVEEMMSHIMKDLPYKSGDEVAVLINGLGSTPLEEQYIMFRKVYKILEANGIKIHRAYVGEFATSLEMAGASISLIKLDDELKELIDMPANTPFFRQMA